jgi:hypothetical protein
MAYNKRKNPAVKGRAGNYAADVDTVGMDPAMKESLTGKESRPAFKWPWQKKAEKKDKKK